MIRLTLPWLVFTALFVFLAGILIAWVGYEITRRRAERRKLLSWTGCNVCAFRYRATPSATPSRCPQCGSLNEPRPLRAI